MIHSITGIWSESTDQFEEYVPYVYTNSTWSPVLPYAYTDDTWEPCGAAQTLYIPFITSDGNYFYTSDGKMFLVKAHD